MARPIGSKAIRNGKVVYWAGEHHSWQSPQSFTKLQQAGELRLGSAFVRNVGQLANQLVNSIPGARGYIDRATAAMAEHDAARRAPLRQVGIDPNKPDATSRAIEATSKATNINRGLIQTAAVVAQAGIESKAGIDALRILPQARQVQKAKDIAAASRSVDNRVSYFAGIPINPNSVELGGRSSAPISFLSNTDPKKLDTNFWKPYSVDAPNVPKPKPSLPDAPESIVDPRYMGVVAPFVEALELNADAIKALREGGQKSLPRTSRLINQIYGEPNPSYMWDLLKDVDPADYNNLETLIPIFKKADSRMSSLASQHGFAPRFTEGHHPVQVESVSKASAHLPFEDRMIFVDDLHKNFTYSGNAPEDMFQLSPIGHQGNYVPKGTNVPFNAHNSILNEDLAKPEHIARTGDNWSTIDFSHITDPKELSKEFWRQSGEPQMRMAEIAYDQKPEVQYRTQLANALGVRERDLYTIFRDGKPGIYKQQLKDMGLDADKIKDIMQRSYQLP